MTFPMFTLALGNACSVLMLILPVTTALLWRIRIEKWILADVFPEH